MKNIITILFIFYSFTIFAQKGTKGTYSTKKPVTVESLTKDAVLFDTFVETGGKVYYKKRTKKDGTIEDYYFTVVEKTNKKGEKYLTRQKVYVVR